jgi:hypothetical protein
MLTAESNASFPMRASPIPAAPAAIPLNALASEIPDAAVSSCDFFRFLSWLASSLIAAETPVSSAVSLTFISGTSAIGLTFQDSRQCRRIRFPALMRSERSPNEQVQRICLPRRFPHALEVCEEQIAQWPVPHFPDPGRVMPRDLPNEKREIA